MGKAKKTNIVQEVAVEKPVERADLKKFLNEFEPSTVPDGNTFNFSINISGADTGDEKEIEELRELSKDDFTDDTEDISSFVMDFVSPYQIKPDQSALQKLFSAAKSLVTKSKHDNAFVIEKDASGQYRWIGWVTNNFKDRDKEILTDAAHKDYIDWLDDNPELAPVLLVWHTAGTQMEKDADFWMYENGFVTMSGPLTDDEAFGLLKVAAEEPLGMSHGFFALDRDPQDAKNITKYRTYEVSVLPLEKAANPWTNIQAIIKEATMSGKSEFLAKILGDEKAEKFLEVTGIKQSALREAEVEEKEAETPEEEAKDVETPVDEVEAKPEAKELLDTIVAKVKEDIGLDELSEWVKATDEANADTKTVLNAILDELKQSNKSKEDEIVEMFTPPMKKSLAWRQPSEADDNVLNPKKKEDKELLEKTPGLPEGAWLSKATGTTPVQAEVQ